MNAPFFLPAIISALLILVAGYAAWRVLAGPALGLHSDIEADVLLLVAGVAGAGLISSWAHTLPRPVWSVLFTLASCYFIPRAAAARAQRPRRNRLIAHAAASLVLLYMFLAGVAPTTLHGSTAGQYTMAGMPGMYVDTTITYPAVGLVCVAAMALYAAASISRLSCAAEGQPKEPVPFAPRVEQVCRVVLALALAYAILSKLV